MRAAATTALPPGFARPGGLSSPGEATRVPLDLLVMAGLVAGSGLVGLLARRLARPR
jgi:hypothetical protein